MKLPHPLVILFGAGATRGGFVSQEIPPPVDADFFDIARRIGGRGTGRLATAVAKDVYELYGRVSGIGLERYYRDIETRYELGTFAKTENRPKDWKKRQAQLEELVRRVLIHTTCDLDKGAAKPIKSELHGSLLGETRAGDTIITFNYDTVIEESMPEGASWNPRNGYGVTVSGLTHQWAKTWFAQRNSNSHEDSKIALLKLHGSVNWVLYKTNQVRLKPRPYVVRARHGKPVFDHAAMLPPGWHKRVDRNPYKELWRQARLKLEQCKGLIVVGYSLPETDLIASALIAEASRSRAARNSNLQELHVADISDISRNRIIDLFIPALGKKGLVYRYTSAQHLVDNLTK
jgi:hypothetical protein